MCHQRFVPKASSSSYFSLTKPMYQSSYRYVIFSLHQLLLRSTLTLPIFTTWSCGQTLLTDSSSPRIVGQPRKSYQMRNGDFMAPSSIIICLFTAPANETAKNHLLKANPVTHFTYVDAYKRFDHPSAMYPTVHSVRVFCLHK